MNICWVLVAAVWRLMLRTRNQNRDTHHKLPRLEKLTLIRIERGLQSTKTRTRLTQILTVMMSTRQQPLPIKRRKQLHQQRTTYWAISSIDAWRNRSLQYLRSTGWNNSSFPKLMRRVWVRLSSLLPTWTPRIYRNQLAAQSKSTTSTAGGPFKTT